MKRHILSTSSVVLFLTVAVACTGGDGDAGSADAKAEVLPEDAASVDVTDSWSPDATRLPPLHVDGRMIKEAGQIYIAF